ncbi:MAG: hypothetical protein Q7O66_06875, partial [Dehalococcoidia bacterium]|nr:hypothetical protein [Dehalococcoidia bacterium]
RDFEGVPTSYHSTKGSGQNLKVPGLDENIDKFPQTRDLAEKKRLALEAVVMGKNLYSRLSVVGVYPTMGVSSKVGSVPRRPVAEIFGYTYEEITHAK